MPNTDKFITTIGQCPSMDVQVHDEAGEECNCYSPVQEQRGQQQHQQQEAEDRVLSAQLPQPVHLHPTSEFLQKSRDDPHLDSPVEPKGHMYPATAYQRETYDIIP